LTAHPGAWADPDTGLLVVGHGIFNAPQKVANYYANDPRWWKYPGNFHGRGKEWQRRGHMELIAPDGKLLLEASVGVRINGQMTRGFPQHAFRLLFDDPVDVPLFPDGDGPGTMALILRPAGNDQVKAMLRDAYQHRLCQQLPFATSQAITCVTYLNGAYWGVHHLRQRMDEHEIARRYGIKAKKVALLEDRARPVNADTSGSLAFMRLVVGTERWDGRSPSWIDTLHQRMDVDGYLTYMASQMILGNMDWPQAEREVVAVHGQAKTRTALGRPLVFHHGGYRPELWCQRPRGCGPVRSSEVGQCTDIPPVHGHVPERHLSSKVPAGGGGTPGWSAFGKALYLRTGDHGRAYDT
jgi:hypothetical protein